jgi:hypothetical protein
VSERSWVRSPSLTVEPWTSFEKFAKLANCVAFNFVMNHGPISLKRLGGKFAPKAV